MAATVSVGLVATALAGCAGGTEHGVSGISGKTVRMFTWVGNPDEKAQCDAYIDGGNLADPMLAVQFAGPAIGSFCTVLPTQLKGRDSNRLT